MSDRDRRPSPEALLKQAANEAKRGRLKIFLGAAPGVGKTWAMLSAAQARVREAAGREGADLVVGVVETHGRADTAAVAVGLETIPRRPVVHRGHMLDEMDLDAILARHPAVVLVDELAHSNAPGSRHPKRHMDVAELLAAGIDVWTTLNIQHVESLNDVVAGITRIRVRETVPDGIIDAADEIELVDLTPQDLLQRLREGRIYLPKTASRALANYFSIGNLTALRELALRRTAQRVDAQLLDHMQAHAISGPWAASERVLVCLTRRGSGEALVRYASRLAGRMRAPWTALHVETAAALRAPETERGRIAACMRLAQTLGAEAVTIPGRDVAADILAYAREHNATQIVLGNPGARRWWRRSVADAVLAVAEDIPVHIAPAGQQPATAVERPQHPPLSARPYVTAVLLVAAAVLAGEALREVLAVGTIALAFLTAVLASAIIGGLAPSLVACLLSVLAYNFLFLPPLYTFTIAAPENVVALFFFAVTAVLVSNLAAAVRAQALAARQRARTTEDLYGFSRKLAGIGSLDDLLWATAYQIAAMLKLRVMLLLPDDDASSVSPRAGYPPEDVLDAADLAAAQWCWRHDRPAGRGADTLPGARRLFLPLRTGRGSLGVIGLDRAPLDPDDTTPPGAPWLTPDQQRLLDALADQAAVSIERVQLAADLDNVRVQAEADRLRAALLTAVSHDLRTPLATISGAAETVLAYDANLPPEARRELLASIIAESARMGRFIANLLDMTRIEAGAVRPRREAVDVGEAIGSAVARAAAILCAHVVTLDIAADLPLPQLDPVLLEQVLVNLLDNAAKYAPPGTTITIQARQEKGRIMLRVRDEGPGIPPAELARVFDAFHRAAPRAEGAIDGRPAGTGLGLAICRGFLAAMGGSIEAANYPGRGAVFTVTLPLPPEDA
jgi:two-component system sensor histidine kinase KdpD